MLVRCDICGTLYNKTNRSLVCSEECRKIYYRRFWKSEEYRTKIRQYQRARQKVKICEYCGKQVKIDTTGITKPRVHEQCVVDYCMKYIAAGIPVPNKHYQRLYVRGYTVEELRSEIENEKRN